MNREQDFCTPADILAEHGTGSNSADCPYANLRQAVANLIRKVNELEDRSIPCRYCRPDADKPVRKPMRPAERLVPAKYVVNKQNDISLQKSVTAEQSGNETQEVKQEKTKPTPPVCDYPLGNPRCKNCD